jgi:pimeloyl-ACP methyl ester carboxylesterase
MLDLHVIIVPARSGNSAEPIFVLAGGPGQAATEMAWDFADDATIENDLVFLDLRGTSAGQALDCTFGVSDENAARYLEPFLAAESGYAACRDELSKTADLTQYTTMIAMQDVDDLRIALGKEKIHLDGGSYGTRAAMVYMHMFGSHVKTAFLSGLVPVENRSPLYHAFAAQRAFDLLVEQCSADARCHAAYPSVAEDLRDVLQRLREKPASLRVPHPVTHDPIDVTLTAEGFADGLRTMLYDAESERRVPLLLRQAGKGDLAPFAEAALASHRSFDKTIHVGLMLSFTCAEDTSRIRADEVEKETKGSFIADQRVRSQMAACAVWPQSHIPPEYYRSFRTDVPTVLISGEIDPVTPPQWGELALRSFPNGRHLVFPGAHVSYNDCIAQLARDLRRSGTTVGLDTSCVASVRNPPFAF